MRVFHSQGVFKAVSGTRQTLATASLNVQATNDTRRVRRVKTKKVCIMDSKVWTILIFHGYAFCPPHVYSANSEM